MLIVISTLTAPPPKLVQRILRVHAQDLLVVDPTSLRPVFDVFQKTRAELFSILRQHGLATTDSTSV